MKICKNCKFERSNFEKFALNFVKSCPKDSKKIRRLVWYVGMRMGLFNLKNQSRFRITLRLKCEWVIFELFLYIQVNNKNC